MLACLTFIFMTLLILFSQRSSGQLGPSSRQKRSNACFGPAGLTITANVLECIDSARFPRICITGLGYGNKRPNPSRECPAHAVSSLVDPNCCQNTGTDCVVEDDGSKVKGLQSACSRQSMHRCRLQADQLKSNEFLTCTSTSSVSLYRYIDYICIEDNDNDAKARSCYIRPRVTVAPRLTFAPIIYTTNNPTVSSTILTNTEGNAGESGTGNNGQSGIDGNKATKDRVFRDKLSTKATPQQNVADLSQDDKIILGVCVSIGLLFVVILLTFGAHVLIRRRQIRKKNEWIENNINREDKNNTNQSAGEQAGGENALGSKEISTNPHEMSTIYEEVNELTNDKSNENLNESSKENVLAGSENIIDYKNNTLGSQIIDKTLGSVNENSNHVKSNGNVLNNSVKEESTNTHKDSSNIYDSTAEKIINKIMTTDNINVFKNKLKTEKEAVQSLKNTDSATIRRLAMFVKKCIRDVEGESKPRKNVKERKKTNTVTGSSKNSTKLTSKRKRKNRIVAKPWDFNNGEKSKRKQKRKHRGNTKNTVSNEHSKSFYIGKETEFYNCSQSSHSNSDSEDIPCRFPIRQYSVMRKKVETSTYSESETSDSVSSHEQLQPRSVAVRFQKKLTYIDDELKLNKNKHSRDKKSKKNKRKTKESNSKDSRSKQRRHKHKNKNNADTTRQVKPRRDSLELTQVKKGLRRNAASSQQEAILRKDHRKTSKKHYKHDYNDDEPRQRRSDKKSKTKHASKQKAHKRTQRPNFFTSPKHKVTKNHATKDYLTETESETDSSVA